MSCWNGAYHAPLAQVEPVPQLCTLTGPPKYPAIRYGTHLENKVLKNFEL